MYLYIALILSLATATGFGLLAIKRGNDLKEALRKNQKLEVYLKFIKIEAEISEREIARLKNQIKSMQRADVKEGLILQSHADMARVERSVEND